MKVVDEDQVMGVDRHSGAQGTSACSLHGHLRPYTCRVMAILWPRDAFGKSSECLVVAGPGRPAVDMRPPRVRHAARVNPLDNSKCLSEDCLAVSFGKKERQGGAKTIRFDCPLSHRFCYNTQLRLKLNNPVAALGNSEHCQTVPVHSLHQNVVWATRPSRTLLHQMIVTVWRWWLGQPEYSGLHCQYCQEV